MVVWDSFIDALLDCVKMLPFLFAAFLLMEALEHHAADKMHEILVKTNRLGPVAGALLGCVPQCGFSILASNLYAGGVVTLDTLLAVYLATSDEAVIILIGGQAPAHDILMVMLVKVMIAIAAGYLIRLIMSVFRLHAGRQKSIENLCRDEHCGCHDGKSSIFRSALIHTFKIFFFILIFTFALNVLLEVIGFEEISRVLLSDSLFQPFLTSLIGLIPNCGASVVLTQLYMDGILSFGALTAGLCSSAGLGLIVLFRINRDKKDNLCVVAILYAIAVVAGLILQEVI